MNPAEHPWDASGRNNAVHSFHNARNRPRDAEGIAPGARRVPLRASREGPTLAAPTTQCYFVLVVNITE